MKQHDATANPTYAALKNFVIWHGAFSNARDMVWRSIWMTEELQSPCSALITGPSGVGKSLLCLCIQKQLGEPTRSDNPLDVRLNYPCVYVEVPPKPTILSITQAIATKLEIAVHTQGASLAVLEEMVITRLETLNVRLLILDEFHRLIDQGGSKTKESICRWVTHLLNNSGIPILVLGTDKIVSLIDEVEELAERYPLRATLTPLKISREERFTDFLPVLRALQFRINTYQPIFTDIDLTDENLSPRIFLLTRGNFRRIRNFIATTIAEARDNENGVVQLKDLHVAAEKLFPTMALKAFDLPKEDLYSAIEKNWQKNE